MAGKKKSINDDDFFDDANIDAIAEDIPLVDPDGDGGKVADDAPVEADESVAEGEDAATGDEEAAAEGDAVGDGESDGEDRDPAPHLNDLDTAKVAYAELRKWANQRDLEARKASERIAELEAIPEYDYEEAPVYDPQAFTHIAAQDLSAAFRYAIENDQLADAQAAIAQVQTDANELAAHAAHAHLNGDKEQYAALRAQSVNAAAMAQQLQGEYANRLTAKAQAPLVRSEQMRATNQAEALLSQELGEEYGARRAQVIQTLQETPGLISDQSPQGIAAGLRKAFAIAKATYPDPVAAAQPTPNADETVKAAVDEYLKAKRQAKAEAAEAATGAADTRSGASTKKADPSLKDELYESAKKQSVGARGFMAL